MSTPQQLLHTAYGLEFPDSFFTFWQFAQAVRADGLDLRRSVLEVRLGDAFNACAPQFDASTFDPLRSSRYPLDPPEFLTMLHGGSDGLHWGYYIDDPNHPTFEVAAYFAGDALSIGLVGFDLAEALRWHLESIQRDLARSSRRAEMEQDQRDVDALRNVLLRFATNNRPEIGSAYLARYLPQRPVTAPTRDGMGLIESATLYRPRRGRDLYRQWDYRPTAIAAQRDAQQALAALDAGYPANALQLGKDLWGYAEHFALACQLLDRAYAALGRPWLQTALQIATYTAQRRS